MKKLTAISVSLIVTALLVTGCDFFRVLAGRPTSKDIEAKRAVVETLLVKKEKAVRDSMERVRKIEADSLACVAFVSESLETIKADKLDLDSRLEKRYYIMVGTFAQESNATRLASKFRESGYEAVILSYKRRMNIVALCPSDSIVVLKDTLVKLLADPLCPKSMLLLVND